MPLALDSTELFLDKRWNPYRDNSERPQKLRRLSDQQDASLELVGDAVQEHYPSELHQLPSPSLTKTNCVGTRSHYNFEKDAESVIQDTISSQEKVLPRKRKARSLEFPQVNPQQTKKAHLLSEPAAAVSSIEKWLLDLPGSENLDAAETMSLPPSKRSRSFDSLSRRLSQSGDSTESTVSRDKKYSAYRDVNYPVVLETKGSFMRPSKAGLSDEDKRLLEKLLVTSQPKPTVHYLMMSNLRNFTHSYEAGLRLGSTSIHTLLLCRRLRTSTLVAETNSAALSKATMTSGLKLFLSMDHVRSRTTRMDLNS